MTAWLMADGGRSPTRTATESRYPAEDADK